MVPSGTQLPKRGAGTGAGVWVARQGGQVCPGLPAHLWHVLAQPQCDQPSPTASGAHTGLTLYVVNSTCPGELLQTEAG